MSETSAPPSATAELVYRDEAALRTLSGVKWRRHGEDVLACWVADMDIRPAPVALEAVTAVVERGDFGYNFEAYERIPEAFAKWQQARHGWSLDPGQVRVYASVLQAIDLVLHLSTEPGDGIVLVTPIYPPFLKAVEATGRRVIDVPLDPNGWRLDPERLRSAIDDSTTAILFCNPHNPTGRVFDVEELNAIATVAIEHDLTLLSDEIWADLVHPEAEHTPMGIVADGFGSDLTDRLVTLSSTSKTFNLAGLRCAVAHVASPSLRSALSALPAHLHGGLSTPGAEAALACWERGEPWYRNLIAALGDRRDQLAARLAADAPQIGWQLPEATYLAWLDFSAYELGVDAGAWLLQHARVAPNAGVDFGANGQGFARVNFATSPDMVDRIADQIVGALACS